VELHFPLAAQFFNAEGVGKFSGLILGVHARRTPTRSNHRAPFRRETGARRSETVTLHDRSAGAGTSAQTQKESAARDFRIELNREFK
jgi:hypothetical protein